MYRSCLISFLCSYFTYIFPMGTVKFKSFSTTVWPYALWALLTTTADDGLGTTAIWFSLLCGGRLSTIETRRFPDAVIMPTCILYYVCNTYCIIRWCTNAFFKNYWNCDQRARMSNTVVHSTAETTIARKKTNTVDWKVYVSNANVIDWCV